MKKALFPLLVLTMCLLILLSYFSVVDLSKAQRLQDKEIKQETIDTKEEYFYKEELLNLGYTIDEINIIENKVSNINVKQYLLSEKYNYLTDFIYSPYFKIENIKRYEEYYEKNEYTTDEAVLYVQIGLDIPFYEEVKEIDNHYDTTALVNKYNNITNDIAFDDLVTIKKPYSSDGKKKIRNVAYEPLKKLIDAAKEDGIKLYVISSYRTMKEQTYLFNNSLKKNGEEHALLYSAKPGHSEHQLGLAVDFNTTKDSFKDSKEYEWLKQNAYKYGFIERYPLNKEFITGYGFEPWHYRYLGIDITTKMYEQGITYEEYLVMYANK